MIVKVELTAEQFALARAEGRARQQKAMTESHVSHGVSHHPLRQNIVGAMGEIAFSEWSGIAWTAAKGGIIDTRPDVGQIEVRTRRHESDRDLFVKPKKINTQKPSQIYVLAWATENCCTVSLVGWTTLGDIMENGYDRTDTVGYRWRDLRSMSELKADQ